MTLTKREKTMIIAGVIVISMVMYIMYFFVPNSTAAATAFKKYSDTTVQVNLLKQEAIMSAQAKDQVAELTDKLANQGSIIPTGVEHSGILLYLKSITDGKVEGLSIAIPTEVLLTDKFLIQSVSLDFYTTYPKFLEIMADLKTNKRYNRVTFMKVNYESRAPVPAAQATDMPAATQSPKMVADVNVINVHLELNFYSKPSTAIGESNPDLPPTSENRNNSLFPLK